MLAQYLHQVCRGVLDVLAETAGGEFLACDLVQIDRKEFAFQTVAAAHYPTGPLRRLIVGCEQRLAEHIARALADASVPADGGARAGILALCHHLEERLGAASGDLAGRPFLLHETARFRVHCDGPRNFHLRVALAEGRLDLLLDLAPREVSRAWFEEELGERTAAVVRGGGDVAITDAVVVERIMVHLSRAGADVQVKIPRSDGHVDLLPATFLGGGYEPDGGLTLLTCARLPGVLDEHATPAQVALVFVLQDRLLEAVCPVLEQQPGNLDQDLALPLLVIGAPGRVTYGQRRSAARFEPPVPLHGTVQRRPRGRDGLALTSRGVPCDVQDISTTGARLAITAVTILSGFKVGVPVDCCFGLPGRVEPARVSGVVRRLNLSADGRKGNTVCLSVEFDTGGEGGEGAEGLAAVGDYVCKLEAAAHPSGMVLEPC